MAKITKAAIDALMPTQGSDGSVKDTYLWDEELKGFGCKVTPAQRKVYIVQYRMNGRSGKTQRVTLGVHGSVTPDQARKLAKATLGRIADGADPAEERRELKRKLSTGSFREVCERYLEANGKDNTSWSETIRLLRYDAISAFGARPIASLKDTDVTIFLDKVQTRSHSVARAVFAALRPMFRWAKGRGFIGINPMADMKGPKPLARRKRVLTMAELRAVWNATATIGWPFGPLYRLLMLTGQRREEVAGMRWEELNFETGIWRLPPKEEFEPQRTKNGEEHILDLPKQALDILEGLPGERTGLIFTTTGDTPVSGFSRAKRNIDTLMAAELDPEEKKPLPGWRNHDLRRTMATMMGEELKVEPWVIERILNHISGTQGGLMGIYQQQKYKVDRRAAMMAWGDLVERIVTSRSGCPANG